MDDARPEVIRRLEAISAERNHARSAAFLVGVVIAVALFLGGRQRAPLIAPPAAASEAPATSQPSPMTVIVHVAGAVRRPGVYELAEGARVSDALDLAGGVLRSADLTSLNLAEVLVDGRQIVVVRRGQAPNAPVPAATAMGIVDLNTADQSALESVPGIGPVKAAAILAYRAEIGTFRNIDQLLEVTGIGAATLESLRPYVSI
ncbi:MAG: ComEA family DNA-binding protein [Actinomycetota bacterium]|nr:ComEA family DNA-binding protein [Actinomycetota bacterium]